MPFPDISASQGERRQLTVLFCDVVGSTELSQKLDPEDLRELIFGYQEVVGKVVERYAGHVAQYLGDGVVVHFGHPMAHDNDAERAVRAAYDMLAALKGRKTGTDGDGASLRVRIGIHTGPVVIGQVRVGDRREHLALGDTTNMAARLQSAAEPNQIVVSHATRKLVPGLFVTRDLGELALKGVEKPMQAYQILHPSGMRSRLEASDYLTPFVGRESELALLLDCWGHAQDGQGGGAVVTAEPGLGKSRLLFTLRQRIQDDPHSWLECRASPFGLNSAWQPIIEMLQSAFGLKDGDPKDQLQRLEQSMDQLGFVPADTVPLLASLLEIELSSDYPALQISPELKRKRTMDLLIAGTIAVSKAQPLVLVIEDLHWADPSSVELLGLLLDQVPTHPIFVVMTARPEFQPPWRLGTHLTALSLRPLRNKEATQMLASLTGKLLAPEVHARILARAGGVPLFVEEIVRMLLESGQVIEKDGVLDAAGSIQDLKIPETLQDSLMARLDRLGDAKLLIQQCAVIGREVTYGLIAALFQLEESTLQQQLQALVQAQLLYPRGAPPDASYVFKHALIQDSAYNSLLKATRQKLHGAIAGILATQFPSRAAQEPATLAQHFEAAGDVENAARWYRRANDVLSTRSAHAEIMSYSRHALSLLATIPDSPQRRRRELHLLLQLSASIGAAFGYGNPEYLKVLETAAELSKQVNDALLTGAVISQLSLASLYGGDFRAVVPFGKQLTAMGEALDMDGVRAGGDMVRGAAIFHSGRFREAHELLGSAISYRNNETIKLMLVVAGFDYYTMSMTYDSWALWLLGYPDQALAAARTAEEEALRLEHPQIVAASGALGRPKILNMRRQFESAVPLAEAAAEYAGRHGLMELFGALAEAENWVASAMIGDEEAAAGLQKVLARNRSKGLLFMLGSYHGMEAEVWLRLGRLSEARTALAHALEMVEKGNERDWEAELHRVQGELTLAENPADTAGAQACFEKAIDIARGQEAKSLELRAATSLARLLQKQNRGREARELLEPIYAWFTEGFETPDLRDAKALLGQLR